MGEIAERITGIKTRIERACAHAGRDPARVCLVAVTKGINVNAVREAYDSGLRVFGENYLQEAEVKIKELPGDIMWHFIGHLQRRKVKDVVKDFDNIHSIDSVKVAGEVSLRAMEQGKIQKVFIQINVGDEESKSGFGRDEALASVKEIAGMKGITLQGFMCIPPAVTDAGASRPYFRDLRDIRDTAERHIGLSPGSLGLSMGMSGDFEAAIEEGASHIRVGTAIFGARR